jgi:hypothetical protein
MGNPTLPVPVRLGEPHHGVPLHVVSVSQAGVPRKPRPTPAKTRPSPGALAHRGQGDIDKSRRLIERGLDRRATLCRSQMNPRSRIRLNCLRLPQAAAPGSLQGMLVWHFLVATTAKALSVLRPAAPRQCGMRRPQDSITKHRGEPKRAHEAGVCGPKRRISWRGA